MLLPLRHVNTRHRVRYFETAPDAALSSYWEPPRSRGGGVVELAPETDAAALVSQAGAHWLAGGDKRLASLVPDLIALRAAMTAEPAAIGDDGEISISVYPLF